jgi:hypothetical protein
MKETTEIASQLATEQDRVAQLERALDEERRERESAIAAEKVAHEQERVLKDAAISNLQDRLESEVGKLHRLLKGAAASVIAAAAVASVVTVVALGWVTGKLSVALVVTAGSLLLAAAVGIAAGWKRALVAFASVGVVLGFVAAIYQLLS